jgi:hypothetical protein
MLDAGYWMLVKRKDMNEKGFKTNPGFVRLSRGIEVNDHP